MTPTNPRNSFLRLNPIERRDYCWNLLDIYTVLKVNTFHSEDSVVSPETTFQLACRKCRVAALLHFKNVDQEEISIPCKIAVMSDREDLENSLLAIVPVTGPRSPVSGRCKVAIMNVKHMSKDTFLSSSLMDIDLAIVLTKSMKESFRLPIEKVLSELAIEILRLNENLQNWLRKDPPVEIGWSVSYELSAYLRSKLMDQLMQDMMGNSSTEDFDLGLTCSRIQNDGILDIA